MKNNQKILDQLLTFRQKRDWKQFHNPKDISISLVLEAGELLEHFQWKSKEEVERYVKTHKTEIGEELADVFNWVLLLSHDLGIDIISAAEDKIKKNADKYPVEKSKGKHTKHTEL